MTKARVGREKSSNADFHEGHIQAVFEELQTFEDALNRWATADDWRIELLTEALGREKSSPTDLTERHIRAVFEELHQGEDTLNRWAAADKWRIELPTEALGKDTMVYKNA